MAGPALTLQCSLWLLSMLGGSARSAEGAEQLHDDHPAAAGEADGVQGEASRAPAYEGLLGFEGRASPHLPSLLSPAQVGWHGIKGILKAKRRLLPGS